MGSAHRIIRQLIPLQHRLLSKPITQELLRSQRRCFVGIYTGAMLKDQNGVIKTSAAVPEQHQTVTAIAPEKSELGLNGSGSVCRKGMKRTSSPRSRSCTRAAK